MNDIKIGDVVYLNSQEDFYMTVSCIEGKNVQCIYYNTLTQELKYTPMIPMSVITKVI